MERGLEDRFDHELHCRLDDAVFDHRDAQRSRPAVALRDLDPPDRLRAVAALPHGRPKLGQVQLLCLLKPLHALPIHTRCSGIGPDLPPGRRQRGGRVHLVDQTVPTSSFDAVLQRRHHAVRPHRGFHPRPIAGFCTLCSPRGHSWCFLCLVAHFPPPPSCPAFPRRGFAPRASRGSRRCGTTRALTPAAPRQPGRSLCLPCPAFRTSHPQPRDVPGSSLR